MKFRLVAAVALLSACVSYEQPNTSAEVVAAKPGTDELNRMIAEVDTEILTDEKAFQEEELASASEENGTDNADSSATDRPKTNTDIGVQPQPNESLRIPMELNSRVEQWITFFTVKDRDRFQRFLNRGEKYKQQVVEILQDYGVPTELYYLAMIESGFVTEARSHASAVGIWQFIPGTGKRYGLERNNYMDERVDPFRATMAAAAYLKDLNRVFQSWYLAMAAYNAGEGRILQSIMKSNTRDFWELVKKSALPTETMNYVPKFLAAAIIGHNPEKFGFKIEKESELPDLVQVSVPSPIRLNAVSDAIGLPLERLREFNPHLTRAMTPPGKSNYEIWVPTNLADALNQSQDVLRKSRLHASPAQAMDDGDAAGLRGEYYSVRRGDTLARIAKRYGTTTAMLRTGNGMRSNRLIVGSKLRISVEKPAEGLATPKKYRVQRGDNLAKIATRFGVSIHHLKKVNRLHRRAGLRVGQLLKIATNQT